MHETTWLTGDLAAGEYLHDGMNLSCRHGNSRRNTGLTSDTAISDEVHVATMHRADAPIGWTARFHMRKLFDVVTLTAGPGRAPDWA